MDFYPVHKASTKKLPTFIQVTVLYIRGQAKSFCGHKQNNTTNEPTLREILILGLAGNFRWCVEKQESFTQTQAAVIWKKVQIREQAPALSAHVNIIYLLGLEWQLWWNGFSFPSEDFSENCFHFIVESCGKKNCWPSPTLHALRIGRPVG